MAARQSILVDSLDRHLAAADLPARKGVYEPRAVGLLERDLDGSRQSDQCLSGDPWTWRLLGDYPREVSLHSVRNVSLDQQWRPALAILTFIALFFLSSR